MVDSEDDFMAKFIEGVNRNQLVLFPESVDDYIDENNDVRFIDAFVDSLDMKSQLLCFQPPLSVAN